MDSQYKYAKVERERRFLLHRFPDAPGGVRIRRIVDHYIDGTTLRLREQYEDGFAPHFKLTQKISAPGKGARQGLTTTLILSAAEFGLLSKLPAKELSKTRHSVPPFGIDVFEGTFQGLILAEAEFGSAEAADALIVPSFAHREVTSDDRFTGGRLAAATRHDLLTWLSGMALDSGS